MPRDGYDYDFDVLGLDKRTFQLGEAIEALFHTWSQASQPDEKSAAQTSLTEAVQAEVHDLERRYRTADAYDDNEVMRYTKRMQAEWKKWSEHHKLEVEFDHLD